jgi:hypothetical protein
VPGLAELLDEQAVLESRAVRIQEELHLETETLRQPGAAADAESHLSNATRRDIRTWDLLLAAFSPLTTGRDGEVDLVKHDIVLQEPNDHFVQHYGTNKSFYNR